MLELVHQFSTAYCGYLFQSHIQKHHSGSLKFHGGSIYTTEIDKCYKLGLPHRQEPFTRMPLGRRQV